MLFQQREITYDGRACVIRVDYGFDLTFAERNNQTPYYSVTGKIAVKTPHNARERQDPILACGQITEDIARYFPEIGATHRWHMASAESLPMHYVANGVYWWETALGIPRLKPRPYDSDPWKWFASTIVYGACPGEDLETFEVMIRQRFSPPQPDPINPHSDLPAPVKPDYSEIRGRLTAWLEDRVPALRRAMFDDLLAIGVTIPGMEPAKLTPICADDSTRTIVQEVLDDLGVPS